MDGGEQTSRPVAVASAGAILAAVVVLATWTSRLLPRHGALAHFNAVKSLDVIQVPPAAPYLTALAAALAVAALVRRPGLARPPVATAAIAAALLGVVAPRLSAIGHQGTILVAAAGIAVLVSALAPARRGADGGPSGPSDRTLAWALWAAVAAVHLTFALHRHAWYGSGSWDHGCMVHNFYRAAHGLDSTSTVLGDVDFLGDHFMIGIYLYAPINWLWSAGEMVLTVQAVNLAATAPAIFGIARHHGLGRVPAAVLALTTGLSFGLQSAAYFDSHEITVGFGFLAWGLWAFETGRLGRATVLLAIFALFKESLGAYVVGLGLLALWRAARQRDRRHLVYGVAWIVGGAVWFVLVNRVFMPALIARANAPEPHETFADFGPTVFEAAIGIATHPMKAIAAVFTPDEKLLSLGVTLGGSGGLALLSPQVGLAALPLFAERFLSSKQTMWQMGYHYAAPLCLYGGWAAARGWGVAERWLDAALSRAGRPAPAARVLSVYVLVGALGIAAFGYRHAANYFVWTPGYFSTPARKAAHDGAVALLRGQGRGARLAVQNRILPHLADRPVIYRLGDWEKADWVLLSVGESAWPWDDGLPRRLARRLARHDGWRLVYAQEGTGVFARAAVTDLPEVAPSLGLGLPRPPPPRPAPAAPPGPSGTRGEPKP